MNDITMPSMSIDCLDACQGSAIRLSGQALSKTVDLRDHREEAWDRTHHAVNLLARAFTDADGYSIAYAAEELGRPGKHLADLVLRVFDAGGGLLGALDSRCQAPAALVLDLLVDVEAYQGSSDLEVLTRRRLPFLPDDVH